MRTIRLFAYALLVSSAVPAFALHRDEIPTVVSLAHQLESCARHAAQVGEAQAHHFSWTERRMLRSLDRFAASAGRLHASVESYFSSPWQTERLVDQLNRDADRVEAVMFRSHAVGHMVSDWSRCAGLLRQINGYLRSGEHDELDDEHAGSRERHGFIRRVFRELH